MIYWRATVERPDGDGGWTVVGVFGTWDTPGGGSARSLYGDTALDAAKLLLSHVWPINIVEFFERKDPGRWADEANARTGIADHRITVSVDDSRPWRIDHNKPAPEPGTFTVAELRLADIRAETVALTAAAVKLKDLTEQVHQARADVRLGRWRVEQAKKEATRDGVAAPDVAKAGRQPRRAAGGASSRASGTSTAAWSQAPGSVGSRRRGSAGGWTAAGDGDES